MSYISNNTRVSSVTIAGQDYTSNFVEMSVSDSSANKNGCIQTSGTLTLGSGIDSEPSADYFRQKFKRGDLVEVLVADPGGSAIIHPRGALYVIATTYQVEEETLLVEIACRLSLLALTEANDPERLAELIDLVPVELDPVQSSYNNCCAGLASAGKYVYQNSSRQLEVRDFWDGDNTAGTAPGAWVSVLGVTTNEVSPLSGGGAIPDEITLSYQVPSDGANEDNKGRVDTVETDSYYFLQYPVSTFQRQNTDATAENPNGTLDNINSSSSSPGATASGSGSCGNDPLPPDDRDSDNSCNEGYSLAQTPIYLPATRREVRETTYDGPSAQVSMATTEVFGPRLEANTQYFADSFAFCRQTYATACNFDGGCSYDGMDEVLLSRQVQLSFYGEANELVKSTTDNYVTLLSAAQVSDWRAGNVSGEIQDFSFRFLTDATMFRANRIEEEYYREGSLNVQKTTTYDSLTTRGVGIGGGQDIDAVTGGVVSVVIRRSSSNSTIDIQPDIANSPTTATEEREAQIPLFTGRFTTPPSEAGPYIVDESIPQPVLLSTEEEIESLVADYANYLSRFYKGDAFGLQIAEGLRSEVLQGYYPGMPFRYYDPKKGVLLAMRMDATTWGVSNSESAFVTSAMWNGESNGTVTIPSNVLGNSTPSLDGPSNGVQPGLNGGGGSPGSPTPPTPVVPPSVDDETDVDSGTFAWYVDVNLSFGAEAATFTPDGIQAPRPAAHTVTANWTTVVYVDGLIVETGGLLATSGDGSIPIDYNGSLVTDNGVLVGILF